MNQFNTGQFDTEQECHLFSLDLIAVTLYLGIQL